MEQLGGMGNVLLASLLCLVACAFFAYIGMVASAAWSQWPRVNWPVALLIPGIVIFWGLVIGLPIVLVLAAPAYALLLRAGRRSFPAATAIGITPGLAILAFSRELGIPAICTGLIVALGTHAICRVRPNNSSKPTPLRIQA